MKRLFLLPFLFFTLLLQAQQDILWGGAGDPDSEFAGGLNGWTTVGITCPDAIWVWEADGKADQGAYAGTSAIASPSVSNGAAVFDSDFYDNAGIEGNFGLGLCAAPHVAELISPIMDLSGAGKLSLKFNEYFRQFQSTFKVAWSADGGNSWSEDIIINEDIAINAASQTNRVEEVALKNAVGTSQFRVKFIMEGNYYFWIVDDVQIIERESDNMQVNTNFYAIPPNYQTPKSMVEQFGFLADIENVGGNDQEDVKLNVTIKKDAGGATVYSEDNFYGTVPSDSLVENVSFGGYTPPAEKANYTGTYTISSSATDSDLSNNSIQFKFQVTDSTFAKEKGITRDVVPAEGNWSAGELHSWAYGNDYYVPNGDEGFAATSASFGIGNASELAGKQLFLYLYFWNDENLDGNADVDERTPVGVNVYTIQGNESASSLRKVALYNLDFEGPPTLDLEGHYLMMVEYTATDDKDFFTLASEEFDYGAMVLNSAQQGAPRYAGMLGINEPLTEEAYSSVGFGTDIVPTVRMHVNQFSGTNELSPENNRVDVFPNPASNMLNVDMALEKTMENVYLTILNSEGKMVWNERHQNLQQDKVQVDISNFPAGNYAVIVATEAGQTVRKFVVQR